MAKQLSVGDEAPNFDLSTTEGAVLMLCDEVPRNFVVLYFFGEVSEVVSANLRALAGARKDLAAMRINVLGVAPLKMTELQALQAELELPFPLCRDDRDFSQAYGIEAGGEEEVAAPALVLVGRDQAVCWLANPLTDIGSALGEMKAIVASSSSSTVNYPKKVVNRLVDRWVN